MRSVRLTNSNISGLILAVIAMFSLADVKAQDNNPFSRYGLGEYYTNQHVISRSMGGLTTTYSDGRSINFNNPATYGYGNLSYTIFDLGVVIDSRTLSSKSPVGKSKSSNFLPSYIAVGIPLKRKKGEKPTWGLAFGLKPLSRISYSVEHRERSAGDSTQALYEGNGGLNQAFVGLGMQWKKFSIGINTGYNFGRKDIETQKNFLNDTIDYYSSKSKVVTNYGGAFLGFGAQYDLAISTKANTISQIDEVYSLRFGVTGMLKQNMNATQDIIKQTFIPSTVGDVAIDSVLRTNDVPGKVSVPGTYAAGISFRKTASRNRDELFEFWSIGAEYTSTKWTEYRFYGFPDRLADSWQLKLGLQFAPDPLSIRNYWSVVSYRAGVYVGKDYLDPDGNGLKQFGISFGAGLPIRRWTSFTDQFTILNTAFQFGKRGSSVNNVTETYFQLSLGFSLSDIWFVKRRYD
jgi:hypothetical protein